MAFSVASLQLRGTQTHAAELQFCTFVKAIQVAYKKLPKRKTSKIYICIIAKKNDSNRYKFCYVICFVVLDFVPCVQKTYSPIRFQCQPKTECAFVTTINAFSSF